MDFHNVIMKVTVSYGRATISLFTPPEENRAAPLLLEHIHHLPLLGALLIILYRPLSQATLTTLLKQLCFCVRLKRDPRGAGGARRLLRLRLQAVCPTLNRTPVRAVFSAQS